MLSDFTRAIYVQGFRSRFTSVKVGLWKNVKPQAKTESEFELGTAQLFIPLILSSQLSIKTPQKRLVIVVGVMLLLMILKMCYRHIDPQTAVFTKFIFQFS